MSFLKKNSLLTLTLIVLVLLGGTGLAVKVAQDQQENRTRAATSCSSCVAGTCGTQSGCLECRWAVNSCIPKSGGSVGTTCAGVYHCASGLTCSQESNQDSFGTCQYPTQSGSSGGGSTSNTGSTSNSGQCASKGGTCFNSNTQTCSGAVKRMADGFECPGGNETICCSTGSVSNKSGGSTSTGGTANTTAPAKVDDSSCDLNTASTIPTILRTGETFNPVISFTNNGTTTWTPGANYKVSSKNPDNNTVWGTGRIPLEQNIPPNTTAHFTRSFKAPSTPGNYFFTWEMLIENVKRFGATCGKNISVISQTAAISPAVDSATCDLNTANSIPDTLKVGQTFTPYISFTNTGNTTWTPGAKYLTGTQNPVNNSVWGAARIPLEQNIPPNTTAHFRKTFTAPSTPNTYHFSWQMLIENEKWFGPVCGKDITVTAAPISDPVPPNLSPPANTSLSLTIFLHGIGNSGDNTNPTGSSGSNKNPKRPTLSAQALIYNSNNTLVSTATGNITYNPTNGNYGGTLSTPSPLAQGQYIVRVKVANHLVRLVPGFQTITSGQTLTLPAVAPVAGDVNNDNVLNILDFNMISDCFSSDITTARNCSDTNKKVATDLNDDGNNDLVDFSLYLREVANQTGE